MSSLIELRPNKDLLNDSFIGYKLAFDSVPVYVHKLQNGVDLVQPSDDQYSFLHVKVFGFHNHLCGDPWCEDDVYYIDKEWKVQKSMKNESTGMLNGVLEVWELPSNHMRKPGHYNTSLSFPSPELAVVADGAGTLHLVSTGSIRGRAAKWKVLFSDEVCGKEKPFIIIDSRMNTSNKIKEVHILLLWIDDVRNCDDGDNRLTSYTKLEWITLAEGETQEWSLHCIRQLSGAGGLDYAALEPGCQSLYISSEKSFKFTSDSANPIEVKKIEDEVKEKQPNYMWLQTAEDITLWFQVDEGVTKSNLNVHVDTNNLKIEYKGLILLEGSTWHCLESQLTTWTLERSKLEIILTKAEQGLMWQELVKGDSRGEQVTDPALVEEIHQRLAHLCSDKEVRDPGGNCPPAFNLQQLEECDAFPSEPSLLVRLDARTHDISHRINLGGLQWLFNASLKADAVPSICLRHGNDGCLWQLGPSQENTDWPCTHVGSFPAFGYVQASKTRKKFCPCAPDMSYVAVCETSRHVFLYRRPSFLSTDLRNRRTGEKVMHIAKQQIVNLESDAEVLGVHASCNVLYVLTSDTLYALRIVHDYVSESSMS